jgi:ATP-dependent DNA ligase
MSAYALASETRASPDACVGGAQRPDAVHEVKHDGYRLMVRRTASGIRIRTRRGYDWTDRFPLIVESSQPAPRHILCLDGEGVILPQSDHIVTRTAVRSHIGDLAPSRAKKRDRPSGAASHRCGCVSPTGCIAGSVA